MNAESELSAAPARPDAALTIDFGVEGNSAQFIAGGWSMPERKFRWMTGQESELKIEPGLVGEHIIELKLHPLLSPPVLNSQRLTVSVNGIAIGHSTITKDGRFGYRIPAAALAGRQSTSITFTHPDAARPCDVRQSKDARVLSLSAARVKVSRVPPGESGHFVRGNGGIAPAELERIAGVATARFILNFESLGDNCEFALVQRNCGAEPFLSLLRFAGMELPTLLRALEAGMQDFGNPANVEIRPDDKERPELVVHETRYGVFFHTFRYADETRAERLHATESSRLAYCARRFMNGLKAGNKILVVKRNDPLRDDEILPLYAALSAYGRNTLLWMVPADAEHPSGSVEVVLPGLLKGFIERFAPYEDAPDLLLDHWLAVCANAYPLSLGAADGVAAGRKVTRPGAGDQPDADGHVGPRDVTRPDASDGAESRDVPDAEKPRAKPKRKKTPTSSRR